MPYLFEKNYSTKLYTSKKPFVLLSFPTSPRWTFYRGVASDQGIAVLDGNDDSGLLDAPVASRRNRLHCTS